MKLNKFVALPHIFEPQLERRGAAVEVFDDGVAHVNRVAGLDMVVEFGHVEADGGDLAVGLGFLHEVQLEVDTAGTHFAAVSGIIDIVRQEDRVRISGAEGLELLEDTEELGRNLGEVQPGVDVHDRSQFLLGDIARNEPVHPLAELFKVLLLHRQAGGIHVWRLLMIHTPRNSKTH